MKKNKHILIRVSEYEKNKLQMFANRYAEGNLSQWMVFGAMNAPRQQLKKKRPAKATT